MDLGFTSLFGKLEIENQYSHREGIERKNKKAVL